MSKFFFMGFPLWSILVCKISEFWRWKLWDQNFFPFDSRKLQIKEGKEAGFTLSIELRTKFVWSHGLLTIDHVHTTDCALIKTLHTLNFSKHFFCIAERLPFVSTSVFSIRRHKFKTTICQFGVPQGSIFELTLFNVNVPDMVNNTAYVLDRLMIPLFNNNAR